MYFAFILLKLPPRVFSSNHGCSTLSIRSLWIEQHVLCKVQELIDVPLVSVFFTLAIISFVVAAYYGFRLSRLTNKSKVMVMVTKDGPTALVSGLILLASSIVPFLFAVALNSNVTDAFEIPAAILLMSSAGMFAWGFHRMYAVYLNERLKMSVNTVLDELLEKEQALDVEKFQGQYK